MHSCMGWDGKLRVMLGLKHSLLNCFILMQVLFKLKFDCSMPYLYTILDQTLQYAHMSKLSCVPNLATI